MGWGEAHRVRFPPALVLCSLLDLHLWNVLLDVLYSYERLRRLHLSLLSRGGTFHYRERSCGVS